MMVNKVELCGVNTSKLPLLKEEEKAELFERIRALTARERLHAVTRLVYAGLGGTALLPAVQLAGAAFPRETAAAVYLCLLGCGGLSAGEEVLRPAPGC